MHGIIEFDRQLFLILNGLHTPFWDSIMIAATGKFTWIPAYILLLYYLFKKKSYTFPTGKGSWFSVDGGWKIALIVTAAILITFALTDQLSVHLFKRTVCRLRPGHDPDIAPLARLLTGKGGLYGFVSNHASNMFGLAVVSLLFIRKKWYTFTSLAIAFLVGYSRIYVGKHFPGDVVCGALFGALIGCLVYLAVKKIIIRISLNKTTHN